MIEHFMKDTNARLLCGGRWLYWSENWSQWVVLYRPAHRKTNTTLYSGPDLAAALKALGG